MQDLTKLTPNQVRVIQEALYEYSSNRGTLFGAEKYVQQRYSSEHFSKEWLKNKLVDVRKRIAIAEELLERLFPSDDIR